jgi:hypothetical protein
MFEWDHRVNNGWNADTWCLGKHIDEWCDPAVRAALEHAGLRSIPSTAWARCTPPSTSSRTAHGASLRRPATRSPGRVRAELNRLLRLGVL